MTSNPRKYGTEPSSKSGQSSHRARVSWDDLSFFQGRKKKRTNVEPLPLKGKGQTRPRKGRGRLDVEELSVEAPEFLEDEKTENGFSKPYPYIRLNEQAVLLYANPAFDVLMSSVVAAVEYLPSKIGQKAGPVLQKLVKDVLQLNKPLSIEEKMSFDDGVRIYRIELAPVHDEQTGEGGVSVALADCTEDRETLERLSHEQKRFRDFARSTSDWFWQVDRSMRLIEVSDRLVAVTGLPAPLLRGKRLDEIVKLRNGDGESMVLLDAMERRRPFRDQLVEIVDDGHVHLYHLSGVPVFDPTTGVFQGFRGAGMDVTQVHRAEREALRTRANLEQTLEELQTRNIQLDIASAQAETALKAKNEFLAAMSHELRTPLNAIIGFAEAMNMEVFGGLNEHYVSYSGDIMKAGRHLLGLINDVLDVAVVESGNVTLSLEDSSLQEIIDDARSLVMIRAQEKDLNIDTVHLDNDIRVYVDPRRTAQIFVNLLTNAVKFTKEGGTIGINIKPHGLNNVAVTVWDTGIGIPADKLDLVFEKFQQVTDNIYTRGGSEGTGLGLHISRELARMMKGDITLESVIDEGSRFTVILPLAKV